MRKKELIKAISKIEEGIADVKNLLISEEQNDKATGEVAKDSTEAVEPVEETVGRFSKKDLDAMKYNDLKKLGKELGVKCTGTREEITARILGVDVDVEDSNDSEPVKEEKVVPIKKKSVKTEEPEEPEDEGVEEKYLEMAREALEDNSLEDVIEVLSEAGIKLTSIQKKKQDVIMNKLAEAFQNGMIDVDDEEEDEEESKSEDVAESEEELDFSEDSYFDQYDPNGINDPSIMSKKRAEAVKSLVADIISKFESEELTVEDIESELEDYVTDDDVELLGEDYSEEELVAFYIEMKKRFVDDDGSVCEPGEPYEIGNSNFCCGHELSYDKKKKTFICPVCSEEYEAE